MFNHQKGLCKLSGEKLSLQVSSPYKISIDRIDSNKGYTIDNVQLVSKIVNQAKNNLDSQTFNKMIYGIYHTNNLKEIKYQNNDKELILKIKKLEESKKYLLNNQKKIKQSKKN